MINPELQPFLAVWAEKWARLPKGASPAERRAAFEIIAAEMRLPTPEDVETSAEHWTESLSGPVRVRIFRHKSGAVQPALIYMHGGAWMQGSPETHWDITARLASWTRGTVISVDYALAPERPFPAAVNQCVAVVEWAFLKADALGLDPARIAIGGDSAGANLAAALALHFRGGPQRLTGQLLVYPAVDFDMSRPSYRENADGPIVNVAGMPAVNAAYTPNPEDRTNPLAALLRAESHAGLPPAFIAVAEHDPLRDDGYAYAERLRAAGVSVTLDPGIGLIHGYLRGMGYCGDSLAKLRLMAHWLEELAPVGMKG